MTCRRAGTTGSSGDPDLYVKYCAQATITSYDTASQGSSYGELMDPLAASITDCTLHAMVFVDVQLRCDLTRNSPTASPILHKPTTSNPIASPTSRRPMSPTALPTTRRPTSPMASPTTCRPTASPITRTPTTRTLSHTADQQLTHRQLADQRYRLLLADLRNHRLLLLVHQHRARHHTNPVPNLSREKEIRN
jgi:hypothetical protein